MLDNDKEAEEAELILTRLCFFLRGKWCVKLTEESGEDERNAAEEEMIEWFGAAEQVRVLACMCNSHLSMCICIPCVYACMFWSPRFPPALVHAT